MALCLMILLFFMCDYFFISNSFKSIYCSFHIFNCRQLFRTSGPHQYSALYKKSLKNWRIAAAYETSCRLFLYAASNFFSPNLQLWKSTFNEDFKRPGSMFRGDAPHTYLSPLPPDFEGAVRAPFFTLQVIVMIINVNFSKIKVQYFK